MYLKKKKTCLYPRKITSFFFVYRFAKNHPLPQKKKFFFFIFFFYEILDVEYTKEIFFNGKMMNRVQLSQSDLYIN